MSPRAAPGPVRAAAAAGAGFVALLVLVASRPGWLTTGVDGRVSRAVVAALGGVTGGQGVLRTLTWTGEPLVVDAAVLLGALVLWRRRGAPVAVALVGAGLLSLLVRAVVKAALGRARPEPMFMTATGGSFPSGHTAGAAFLAAAAAVLVRRAWVAGAAAVYAAGVGATRVLLDVHWLSDVVGGLLLGVTFGLLVPAAATWIRAGPPARSGRALPDR